MTDIFRKGYFGTLDNPMQRFGTFCCALGQLSLNNHHTEWEIHQLVSKIKQETTNFWNPNSRAGGERAIFVIVTMPYEQPLAEKLRIVGFEKVFDFNRRNGYPEGYNSFWVIKW